MVAVQVSVLPQASVAVQVRFIPAWPVQLAAMAAFIWAVVEHQRQALLDEAADHVTRLSGVIKQSTRFAMLQNQPAYVDRIIQAGIPDPVGTFYRFSLPASLLKGSRAAVKG